LPQQIVQLATIAGFTRDFDTGNLFQDLSHFPAKPGMIVGQQDGKGAVHGYLSQAAVKPGVQAW
jgi:hypothetical protein